MGHKFIRVLGGDTVFGEFLFRKVLEIIGHNPVCAATDSGGENVPVVRVGKGERGNKRLEVLNKAIADMGIHELPGTLQLSRLKVWAGREKIAYPFIMDQVRPFCAEKICQGEF